MFPHKRCANARKLGFLAPCAAFMLRNAAFVRVCAAFVRECVENHAFVRVVRCVRLSGPVVAFSPTVRIRGLAGNA
eukprot:9121191-Alexandrium_andersonii.AAC.1